jgi:hypothetical protein
MWPSRQKIKATNSENYSARDVDDVVLISQHRRYSNQNEPAYRRDPRRSVQVLDIHTCNEKKQRGVK